MNCRFARVPSTATASQNLYLRHNIKNAAGGDYWNAQQVSVPNDNTWRRYSFVWTINPPGGFGTGSNDNFWVQHTGSVDVATDFLHWDDVTVVVGPARVPISGAPSPVSVLPVPQPPQVQQP